VSAISLALVAGSTSAWTTIGVAALTGLLGLASGAGAAAAVTTSHERAERFRERMIGAADAFVGSLVTSEEALDTISRQATELESLRRIHQSVLAQGHYHEEIMKDKGNEIDQKEGELKASLESADKLLKEMERLLPPLLVVFRGERVGRRATRLWMIMVRRSNFFKLFLSGGLDFESNEINGKPSKSWNQQIEEMWKSQDEAKRDLLKSFNASIRKRRL
jgi:hypothetical protein